VTHRTAVRHPRSRAGTARLAPALLLGALGALGALAAAAVGCSRGERGGPAEDSARARRGATQTRFAAVQLAALRDSTAAARLRDSLARAGWAAYLRPADGAAAATNGSPFAGAAGTNRPPAWAVRIAPARNLAYAEIVAAALRRTRTGAAAPFVVQDSGTVEGQGVVGFTRVNYGTHGMAARVRWALAPDRRTLLVVEDPAAVENDPLPNGFVFATERGMRLLQTDSVWDVAPAPDWRRVGFGRAHLLADGAAAAPDSAWTALADSVGLPARALRAAAFPASGMSLARGVAQAAVAILDSASVDQTQARVLYPVASGWRVRWADASGRALDLGDPPEHPRDDTPSRRWRRLDLLSGEAHPLAPTDTGDTPAVAWVEGPTLDVSVAADTARRVLPIDGALIESRDGWIRLSGHVLGPGVALAATRGGRFIVALVPNPAPAPGEAREMLVVYTISPTPLM
jgi:hypothetical protein